MTLESEFRTFLTVNPVVQRISFSMNGAHPVTPAGFRLLSQCFVSQTDIQNGMSARRRIRVRTRPEFLRRDEVAAYVHIDMSRRNGVQLTGDTMLLRRNDVFHNMVNKAIVYHELIHALHDAIGGRTNHLDGEAAAWLGEALFHLECGHNAVTPPPRSTQAQLDNFSDLTEVFPIAEAVKTRMASGTPVQVTNSERAELRTLMRDHGYRSGTYGFQGIRGQWLGRGNWQ